MKIVQIPFCYYPDPHGGTEVYVESLSRHLRRRGVSVLIAAPGESNQSFIYEDMAIKKFKVGPPKDLHDLYGEGNEEAAREFARILDEERPDLIHLHALTRGASLKLVREAQVRKIPVIFTYHTPTVTCQRGTLLRWGKEICDGVLRLHTCSQCTLHGLGLDRFSSTILGSLPSAVGGLVQKMGRSGGMWTALQMTNLMDLRHRTVSKLMDRVNHIIAPAEWVKELLIRNGVAPEKITLSRQGLCHDIPLTRHPLPLRGGGQGEGGTRELKIVFMGRLDPTKGLHLLIQSIKEVPNLELTLDIYGVVQEENGTAYEKKMRFLAGDDSRIRFHTPVPAQEVVPTLRKFDLLAVPSQLLETGPMVILEAFAAGIPVIGSDLGGIRELIEDNVNGMRVASGSVKEWRQVLIMLCRDKELLTKLRQGIRPPRQMQQVADEMEDRYRKCIASACGNQSD